MSSFKYLKSFLFFFILLVNLSCEHNNSRSPQSLLDNIQLEYIKKFTLNKKKYTAIKKLSVELLRACADENCVIVGLGRSPTPIIGFIDNLIPDKAFQLPLSNFRYDPDVPYILDPAQLDMLISENIEFEYRLPLEIERKLFNHFQSFIDFNQLEGKKIVLTDISNQSILAAYKYFKKFLIKTNSKCTLDIIQIISRRNENSIYKVHDSYNIKPSILYIDEFTATHSFIIEDFDKLAKYPSYDIVKSEQAFDFNTKQVKSYSRLRKALRYHQSEDALLMKQINFIELPFRSCSKEYESLI